MAKVTTAGTPISTTWTALANLGQTFTLSVISGEVWLAYASSAPAATATGHLFKPTSLIYTDVSPTEKSWVRSTGSIRASGGGMASVGDSAVIAVSKE